MEISAEFAVGFGCAVAVAFVIVAVKSFLMARANRASIDMIYQLVDRVESDLETKIENESRSLDHRINDVCREIDESKNRLYQSIDESHRELDQRIDDTTHSTQPAQRAGGVGILQCHPCAVLR